MHKLLIGLALGVVVAFGMMIGGYWAAARGLMDQDFFSDDQWDRAVGWVLGPVGGVPRV